MICISPAFSHTCSLPRLIGAYGNGVDSNISTDASTISLVFASAILVGYAAYLAFQRQRLGRVLMSLSWIDSRSSYIAIVCGWMVVVAIASAGVVYELQHYFLVLQWPYIIFALANIVAWATIGLWRPSIREHGLMLRTSWQRWSDIVSYERSTSGFDILVRSRIWTRHRYQVHLACPVEKQEAVSNLLSRFVHGAR